jgi:hypothetical protein
MPKAKNLTLSKSQAACLIALRHGKDFKTKIAIEAASKSFQIDDETIPVYPALAVGACSNY